MVYRVYVEKKPGQTHEADGLLREIRDFLQIHGLSSVRVLNRYDAENIEESLFSQAVFKYIVIKYRVVKNKTVWLKMYLSSVIFGFARHCQGLYRFSTLKRYLMHLSVLEYLYLHPFRKGVYNRSTDAVKTSG